MSFITGPFRAVASGFNMLSRPGAALGSMPLMHIGTAGGAAGGAIGGAVLGGAEGTEGGAATGAAAGAGIGAAAGTGAPMALGLTAGAIGHGTVGAAKGAAGGGIAGFGQGIMNTARGALDMGAGALGGANISGGGPLNKLFNPVGRWTSAAGGIMGNLVRHDPSRSMHISPRSGQITTMGGMIRKSSPFRTTGAGKAVFMGGAAIGGVMGAWDEFATSRMGMPDREITRATPRMPLEQGLGHHDHAGASGDLVFAMNANRRG